MQRLLLWFAACLSLTACATAPWGNEPLSVTLADVSLIEAGLLEQRFGLKLRVQNPNPVEFSVSGLSFEVELNGQAFAKGVSNRGAIVPALGEAVIEVEAVSTLSGILRQALEMQHNRPEEIRYRLKGKLYAGPLVPYPFDFTGSLKLPVDRSGKDSRAIWAERPIARTGAGSVADTPKTGAGH
jgi:LEA14-like dessication related protein